MIFVLRDLVFWVINDLGNKRENAYSNLHTVLEGMQPTTAPGKGTQNLIGALKHNETRQITFQIK
jgi:hypothetical protein